MLVAVNEIYGPVKQGEGKSAGKDVMFLRLSGCNLACIWCDTPYTWNWKGTKFTHPDKYDPKDEVHKMSEREICTILYQKSKGVRALVVSGGEPLLQQERLIPLLQFLKLEEQWWVEIETNGTIVPSDDLIKYTNQFNCSPKTSNSGPDNPLLDRMNMIAISKIAHLRKQGTFKFVVQKEEDMVEIRDYISEGDIYSSQVYLMPEGRIKEEQLERQEFVKEICSKEGYNFSPRLHILEFGNKRAV